MPAVAFFTLTHRVIEITRGSIRGFPTIIPEETAHKWHIMGNWKWTWVATISEWAEIERPLSSMPPVYSKAGKE
jgi:hypothetical protein